VLAGAVGCWCGVAGHQACRSSRSCGERERGEAPPRRDSLPHGREHPGAAGKTLLVAGTRRAYAVAWTRTRGPSNCPGLLRTSGRMGATAQAS